MSEHYPKHIKRQYHKHNIDPSNFNCYSHMDKFMDWVTIMDKFFECKKIP